MRTHYQERQALGTRVQLTLVVDETCVVDELFRSLWLEILLFEKRCSRFLPESELSSFNRSAGVKQPVSEEFRQVLTAAQEWAARTDGLYNPFVLPALQRAGYDHSLASGHEADVQDDHAHKKLVDASRLEVGDTWARIPYGTAIDLGGCGKGYVGDVLVSMAAGRPDVKGFWFSVGGDVVMAGTDEAGDCWTVNVRPSPAQTEYAGRITAPGPEAFAVATSTTLVRQGRVKGKRWHHIIDPRTGQPADSDLVMATVCAGTLLKADVLASCAIIVGSSGLGTLLYNQSVADAAWLVKADADLQIHGQRLSAATA